MSIHDVLQMVTNEIEHARQRHGDQVADNPAIPIARCLAALVEEVGEVARALHDDEGDARVRAELVQVAAVAVLWASREDTT